MRPFAKTHMMSSTDAMLTGGWNGNASAMSARCVSKGCDSADERRGRQLRLAWRLPPATGGQNRLYGFVSWTSIWPQARHVRLENVFCCAIQAFRAGLHQFLIHRTAQRNNGRYSSCIISENRPESSQRHFCAVSVHVVIATSACCMPYDRA